MTGLALFVALLASTTCQASTQDVPGDANSIVAFADGGKFKMLYDNRQRPQSVLLTGRLYIAFNADAKPTKNRPLQPWLIHCGD